MTTRNRFWMIVFALTIGIAFGQGHYFAYNIGKLMVINFGMDFTKQ